MLDVKLVQDTLRKQGARVTVKDVPAEALEPYQFIKRQEIVFRRSGTQFVSEEEIAQY